MDASGLLLPTVDYDAEEFVVENDCDNWQPGHEAGIDAVRPQ